MEGMIPLPTVSAQPGTVIVAVLAPRGGVRRAVTDLVDALSDDGICVRESEKGGAEENWPSRGTR